MIQDYYLMLAGFALSATLIPAVLSRHEKPPRCTCFWHGLLLVGIVICYGTLGLWWGFAGVGLNALMWYILLFQKRKRR